MNKPLNRDEAKRDLHIFIGANCWNWAKRYKYRDFLLLPPDKSPDNYNWELVVRNREILIWLTSSIAYDELRYFAYILLKSKAIIIRVVSATCWRIAAIYRKNSGGNSHG
jgi:hypothetical protein